MRFLLVGNPNCGKTTVFNKLTKSNARVGNWAGVTVEKKIGEYRDINDRIEIVDLPGIYSLSPCKEDEIIARNAILKGGADVLINVIDATNLERSLYLTTQLMELSIPVVLALNMMDEIKESDTKIDIDAISKALSLPIVPIKAKEGEGLDNLMSDAKRATETFAPKSVLSNTDLANPILSIEKLLSKITQNNVLFTTIKLMEDDALVKQELYLAPTLETDINRVLKDQRRNLSDTIIQYRHKFVRELIADTYKKGNASKEEMRTEKYDNIILHKIFAVPLFLLTMFIIFQITFGPVGKTLSDWIDVAFVDYINPAVAIWLSDMGVSEWLCSLICDGVLTGIGTVLTFMPQVVLLFLFLSLLDDIGYTARTAFIMEALLNKIGLTGQSFIPMLMGFGCSVPAIMASRSLQSEKDRRLTIMITPFMSCSARLPVYAVFAGAIFAKLSGVVVFSLYLLGIIVSIISGLILSKTVFRKDSETSVFEMPKYRSPSFRSILFRVLNKSKDFIQRAGTIMFMASVIIWFFQTFDIYFEFVADNSTSMFADVGRFIAPIFTPLGFGNWQASVALLTGVIAKEAVVATLAILYKAPSDASLFVAVAQSFTPLTAYAYLVFVLLYTPCLSAISVMARELNSVKWTIVSILTQTFIAWIVSLLIFQIGSLFLQ